MRCRGPSLVCLVARCQAHRGNWASESRGAWLDKSLPGLFRPAAERSACAGEAAQSGLLHVDQLEGVAYHARDIGMSMEVAVPRPARLLQHRPARLPASIHSSMYTCAAPTVLLPSKRAARRNPRRRIGGSWRQASPPPDSLGDGGRANEERVWVRLHLEKDGNRNLPLAAHGLAKSQWRSSIGPVVWWVGRV